MDWEPYWYYRSPSSDQLSIFLPFVTSNSNILMNIEVLNVEIKIDQPNVLIKWMDHMIHYIRTVK